MEKLCSLIFFICIPLCAYTQTTKQSHNRFAHIAKTFKNEGKSKITPNVNCESLDSCIVELRDYTLVFVRANDTADKKLFINGVLSNMNTFIIKDGHEIDKYQFPDYSFSDYRLLKKDELAILSSLPSCTGISCQYMILQVLDLGKLKCTQTIIKYFNNEDR